MPGRRRAARGGLGLAPGGLRPLGLLGLLGLSGLAGLPACQEEAEPAWIQGYRVVREFPHDPSAYCQGLVYDEGRLHESTGRNGTSSVRTVHLESELLLRRTDLPVHLFGEALARAGEHLVQLTWESGVARVYDHATLSPTATRPPSRPCAPSACSRAASR